MSFYSTYTVKRSAGGHYDNEGIYHALAGSEITVLGSLQPVTGKEMQFLPDGVRSRDLRKFYTPTELKVVNEVNAVAADRVVVSGELFEVISVEDWTRHGLGQKHFKCLLARDNRNDEPAMGAGT